MLTCDRCGELRPYDPSAPGAVVDEELHEVEHFLATGCKGRVRLRKTAPVACQGRPGR